MKKRNWVRSIFKDWIRIFWISAKRFYTESYTYQASALAFITLLSLVPILSVFVYFISFLSNSKEFLLATNTYLYTNFLPTVSEETQQYLQHFTEQAEHLPTLSILFYIGTAVMLILTVEHSLNHIWRTTDNRKSFFNQIISWIIILLLPILIGTIALLIEYLYLFVGNTFKFSLVILLNFIINSIVFTIIHMIVPNKNISLKNGIIGGCITALLFDGAKNLFVLYISNFTSYTFIYGNLAAIPIFLMWLYFSWCVLLYSALIIEAKSSNQPTFWFQRYHYPAGRMSLN